ncbi:unnamed protein product, partial [Hymenolepis diminuta]
LLFCPLIALIPNLSPTHSNPHCGLINTFWSKQLLVFCSRISVSCQPLVVILTPTMYLTIKTHKPKAQFWRYAINLDTVKY